MGLLSSINWQEHILYKTNLVHFLRLKLVDFCGLLIVLVTSCAQQPDISAKVCSSSSLMPFSFSCSWYSSSSRRSTCQGKKIKSFKRLGTKPIVKAMKNIEFRQKFFFNYQNNCVILPNRFGSNYYSFRIAAVLGPLVSLAVALGSLA